MAVTDIKSIIKTITAAVNSLTDSAAAKQQPIYKAVISSLKDLQTKGDTLVNNINNLKAINSIKAQVEKLMIDDQYKQAVKKFSDAYKEVGALHNKYFAQFNAEHGVKDTLDVLTTAAIDTTVNGLTATGLEVGITDPLREMLYTNIQAGGSYADLTEKVRNLMTTNGTGEGIIERYVKTYSTTAINQYSAEYSKTISDDLGLEWYGYDGSLLTTSRPFCEKCVEKSYIHISEIPALLDGDFGPLGKVHISKGTGLPDGLMAGTDPDNFVRRRGGWNCGHQMIAVDESVVPKATRDAVEATAAYKKWAQKPQAAPAKKAAPKKAASAPAPPPPPPPVIPTPAPAPAPKPKAAPKPKKGVKPLTLEEGLKAVDKFPITPAQKKAVEAYSGSSYDPINMFLRGVGDADYLQDKNRYDTIIKDLKEFLQAAPKIAHTTYRGFGLKGAAEAKMLKMLKPGSVFVDDGFMSSTHDETSAFSGNFFLTIHGKSGVPIENVVYSGVKDEREVLFHPGMRFRVLASDLTGKSGKFTATIQEI